jgi:hypothetical protein
MGNRPPANDVVNGRVRRVPPTPSIYGELTSLNVCSVRSGRISPVPGFSRSEPKNKTANLLTSSDLLIVFALNSNNDSKPYRIGSDSPLRFFLTQKTLKKLYEAPSVKIEKESMRKNNVSRCSLIVVLVVFSILLLVAVTDVSATMLGTAGMSDASSSVQFSSWRMDSGSLLSQSSLALGARSNRLLTSNVGYTYTLNTAAVTTQSSYTFRPNRYEAAAPVNYSYSAAAQRVRQPANRRHHRGGASGGVATAVAAVPDIGSSLILFAIALGGFAALRVLPSVRTT